MWKRLPVKESRCPTTSSAALLSRSAVVAVQLPCSFFWAFSADCAEVATSQVPRINQHIVEVSRFIIPLLLMSPSGNGRKSLAFRRSLEVKHPCANIPDDQSHEIRS